MGVPPSHLLLISFSSINHPFLDTIILGNHDIAPVRVERIQNGHVSVASRQWQKLGYGKSLNG